MLQNPVCLYHSLHIESNTRDSGVRGWKPLEMLICLHADTEQSLAQYTQCTGDCLLCTTALWESF